MVPAESPLILLVEDEASIRRGLVDVLRFRGFQVDCAEDGVVGLQRAIDGHHSLIILDVMLPEKSGFEVCSELRARGNAVPILMLTAKGEEDDIVHGFKMGANDYVTKPFGVRELIARVEALIRRNVRQPADHFELGPVRVSVAERKAEAEGLLVELTSRELRMLEVFAREGGHIVSRRMLLRDVWEMKNVAGIETRTVDMHIAKLRKKLGQYGRLIETVRGEGYRLCP